MHRSIIYPLPFIYSSIGPLKQHERKTLSARGSEANRSPIRLPPHPSLHSSTRPSILPPGSSGHPSTHPVIPIHPLTNPLIHPPIKSLIRLFRHSSTNHYTHSLPGHSFIHLHTLLED